jgi:CheY-like chemotaxis protein
MARFLYLPWVFLRRGSPMSMAVTIRNRPIPPVPSEKVVVVNGSAEVLELFDAAFEARRYDVVFVESNEHAYSRIKRVQPSLVILCLQLDSLDGFHVLSMLKLDESTCDIPVLTCVADGDSARRENGTNESPEVHLRSHKSAVRMN